MFPSFFTSKKPEKKFLRQKGFTRVVDFSFAPKARNKVAKPKFTTGFTLAEMLVVVAIIIVISAVVLLRNQRFDSTIGLTNLAHSIALTFREAQVYGTSVRAYQGSFVDAYGLYFDSDELNSYVLFADVDGGKDYDSSSELVELFAIGRGNSIARICAPNPGGQLKCSDSTGDATNRLTIVFERPNPSALIYRNGNTSQAAGYATVEVVSASGSRTVRVYANGQITVEQ